MAPNPATQAAAPSPPPTRRPSWSPTRPQGVGPGQPLWLGLQITHQPDWHTYWKNPGDSGLPTELTWQLPAGLDAGDIAWPVPHKIAIGTLANYGYEGTVLLPVPVTVAQTLPRPIGQGRYRAAQSLMAGVPQGMHPRRRQLHPAAAHPEHHGAAQRRL